MLAQSLSRSSWLRITCLCEPVKNEAVFPAKDLRRSSFQSLLVLNRTSEHPGATLPLCPSADDAWEFDTYQRPRLQAGTNHRRSACRLPIIQRESDGHSAVILICGVAAAVTRYAKSMGSFLPVIRSLRRSRLQQSRSLVFPPAVHPSRILASILGLATTGTATGA